MEKEESIELVSLAHFRGRTFENSVVIIDEFQNLTRSQFRMALGRLGKGSTMIFCGDNQQIDLKDKNYSAIVDVSKIADSTLAELQAMDAQLKNLLEEGKFTEADALAERLKDFRNQLNAGDLDAAVIPPDRTLNANGGLIPPRSGPMSNGIGQMFKRKIS